MDKKVLATKEWRKRAGRVQLQITRDMRDRFDLARTRLALTKAAAFEKSVEHLEKLACNSHDYQL